MPLLRLEIVSGLNFVGDHLQEIIRSATVSLLLQSLVYIQRALECELGNHVQGNVLPLSAN